MSWLLILPFLFDPLKRSDWSDWWAQHDEGIGSAVLSVAIIVVALVVVRIILRTALHRTLRTVVARSMAMKAGGNVEALTRRAGTLETTFAWAADIVLLAIGSGLALSELGFNVTALIAGFGIVGIAVGFGAQTFVKDVINGFFILVEDQFRIGDVVQVGDIAGVVEDINPRRTVLRDLDGNVHFVPNSAIVVATNMTMGFSRINLNVGVAYKESIDRVIEVTNDVCQELARDFPGDMTEPPRVLRVDNLGDSAVEVKVMGDVRIGQQWALMGELRRRLKNRFDDEGIEIPFPHRTVYHHLEEGFPPVPGPQTGRIGNEETDGP